MDKQFVDEVKAFVLAKAKERFGYAGVAESDGFVMINTGEGNVVIEITLDK